MVHEGVKIPRSPPNSNFVSTLGAADVIRNRRDEGVWEYHHFSAQAKCSPQPHPARYPHSFAFRGPDSQLLNSISSYYSHLQSQPTLSQLPLIKSKTVVSCPGSWTSALRLSPSTPSSGTFGNPRSGARMATTAAVSAGLGLTCYCPGCSERELHGCGLNWVGSGEEEFNRGGGREVGGMNR